MYELDWPGEANFIYKYNLPIIIYKNLVLIYFTQPFDDCHCHTDLSYENHSSR